MSAMPQIDRVRGLVLAAPEALASSAFYEKIWGLPIVARDEQTVYLRGSNVEHHILTLETGPARRLAAIEMGVAGAADVTALHDAVRAKGVTIVRAPSPSQRPGGGFSFEMLDHEGRLVRILADVIDHPAPLDDAEHPIKVSHIVLNTPDIEAARAFYGEMFGFVLSDRSSDQMIFLRCDKSHHNIAFNREAAASFNHVSYEVPSFAAVMTGIGRMKANDMPVRWGAGCHGIGGIMFAYFIDPSGFVVEYNHYVKPFDPLTHQPNTWPRSPAIMDAWGTAGLPTPELRAAMAGTLQTTGHV